MLSHGVAVLVGLVGGGGLRRVVGARGQSVAEGHPPWHQTLQGPGDPARGNADHARRESGGESKKEGEFPLFESLSRPPPSVHSAPALQPDTNS